MQFQFDMATLGTQYVHAHPSREMMSMAIGVPVMVDGLRVGSIVAVHGTVATAEIDDALIENAEEGSPLYVFLHGRPNGVTIRFPSLEGKS